LNLSEIQIRDPFVLRVAAERHYYLFGTTDKNAWNGPGTGFDCYRSRDLAEWEGPIAAFRPPSDFWATTQFWAPEVHEFRGHFYMLATFKAPGVHRGTQVLKADRAEGPFAPWSDGPVTPRHWECLDGTLHVDETGAPWMVFCHEWLQVGDGEIVAIRLSDDLRRAADEPELLFRASSAPWARPHQNDYEGHWSPAFPKPPGDFFVTDGPFLHRAEDSSLFMLWSSNGAQGYAMGLARSASGAVHGPWLQEPEPLWAHDGGHGMIFRSFDEKLFVTLHQPNQTPRERAIFRELRFESGTFRI